jgi:hypothetical protein
LLKKEWLQNVASSIVLLQFIQHGFARRSPVGAMAQDYCSDEALVKHGWNALVDLGTRRGFFERG